MVPDGLSVYHAAHLKDRNVSSVIVNAVSLYLASLLEVIAPVLCILHLLHLLPGECIPDTDPALSPAYTLHDLSDGLYLVMPADALHQDRYNVVALFFNYPVVTDADLGLPEQIREGLVWPAQAERPPQGTPPPTHPRPIWDNFQQLR